MAKQKSVHGSQDQTLRTTRCPWHHADVLRQKTFVGNMLAGSGAGVNAQRPHASEKISFCSSRYRGVTGLATC